MPRHRMAPPGGLSVLPGPVLAGGESSEWATRITRIPRFQTPHEPSQPQSQNRTLRNASASDRKGPTPRKDEHTGNNTVTNAIPRIVYRKCVTREPFPFKVGYSHKQMTLVIRGLHGLAHCAGRPKSPPKSVTTFHHNLQFSPNRSPPRRGAHARAPPPRGPWPPPAHPPAAPVRRPQCPPHWLGQKAAASRCAVAITRALLPQQSLRRCMVAGVRR